MNQPRKTLIQALRAAVADKKRPPYRRLVDLVGFAFPVLTMPLTVWFLFENRNIQQGYRHDLAQALPADPARMYRNTTEVFTGTQTGPTWPR